MEKAENYIACCGCYCKTCKAFIDMSCPGCLIGYEKQERDINKAKCKIKICCYKEKKLLTCAECDHYCTCTIISERFKIGSRDNKKCLEALEYIRNNGKDNFINKADKWKGPFGKLK